MDSGHPTVYSIVYCTKYLIYIPQKELLVSFVEGGELATVESELNPGAPLIFCLMIATSFGHIELIDALIHCTGTDVNKCNQYHGNMVIVY